MKEILDNLRYNIKNVHFLKVINKAKIFLTPQ